MPKNKTKINKSKSDSSKPTNMFDNSNEALLVEIENEYKYYKKNMEKHPFYSSTWKMFYEKKYFELKQEGKVNPDKYDYTPEWIQYWTKYMNDYYESKIKFYKKKMDDKKKELSPIILSSGSSIKSFDEYSSFSESESEPKRRKYKLSSISSESTQSLNTNVAVKSEESVTILSVCRLLMVLDSELGVQLSNKIIDLVAQCIELEKIQANSSDEILITNENATIFGTIKEKLKGLISTNLLESKKLSVAKTCIQNIAQLMHQHRDLKIITDETLDNSTKLTDVITKALLAYGKTDILPEELEVITEIYLEELEKNVEKAVKLDKKYQSATDFSKSSTVCFENLNDEDLTVLVKNFTTLGDEEQQGLISFITNIEDKEPERVKQLQDIFNNEHTSQNNSTNQCQETIELEDDEDDYNFEELIAKIK